MPSTTQKPQLLSVDDILKDINVLSSNDSNDAYSSADATRSRRLAEVSNSLLAETASPGANDQATSTELHNNSNFQSTNHKNVSIDRLLNELEDTRRDLTSPHHQRSGKQTLTLTQHYLDTVQLVLELNDTSNKSSSKYGSQIPVLGQGEQGSAHIHSASDVLHSRIARLQAKADGWERSLSSALQVLERPVSSDVTPT